MTITDFQTKLDQVAPDGESIFQPGDRDAFIQEAIKRYSKDKPKIVVEDIAGAGVYDYTPPATWDVSFSVVRSIEYPAGEQVPVYIESDEWTMYSAPSGQEIRFLKTTPPVGKTIRVSFTQMHIVDGAGSTIPEADFDAVVNLAGATVCDALATRFASDTSADIGADSVDHQSKSKSYAIRANKLRGLYLAHLGIRGKDARPVAASKSQAVVMERAKTRLI